MGGIESMQTSIMECKWPKDVKFLKDYEFKEEARTHALRQKLKSTAPSSRKVKFQKITDKRHPAYDQYGLFAIKKLKPGSLILDYIGLVCTESEVSDTSDYVLAFQDGLSIDAEKMGNEARFINDFRGIGERPNCKFDTREDKGKVCMSVYVLNRAIWPGQELSVSYGKGFWKHRITDE